MVIKNLSYQHDETLKMDLYLPQGEDNQTVFLYYYGGGIERGSKQEAATTAAELAAQGFTVAVPDYHMCPALPYPQFVADAAQAAGWLKKNLSKYTKVKNWFIGGHSSGGHIAMLLCLIPEFLQTQGVDANAVNGYIFASAQTTTHSAIAAQKGLNIGKGLIADECAPISCCGGKHPPMLILVGEQDTFPCRVEENALFAAAVRSFHKKADVDFRILPGEKHGTYLTASGKTGISLFGEIVGAFMSARLK